MDQNLRAYTRREFLGNGLLLASAAMAAPSFLQGTAAAMTRALGGLSSAPGVPDERVLVVVQLAGGNDGLNTVVPFGMPEYYKSRPGIAVPEKDVLRLAGSDGLGLHPALEGVRSLCDEGLATIVQGVGYPNPNRSHFKSMDIWHTADTDATGDGWLGRYLDSECCGFGRGEGGAREATADAGGTGPSGIAIGRSAPLAMQGRGSEAVSFESAELFRWAGERVSKDLAPAYDRLNRRGEGQEAREGSNADFLVRTALDAQLSSEQIRKAVAKRTGSYPRNELGGQLQMVASMINSGLRTRVYYISYGGFDTHAGQGASQGRHANLLRALGDSLKAFYADLREQGHAERVLTMSFSEFGRRVGQNASGGTDHGTAAPMLLLGPMVRAGVLGEHPSLKNLDEGDLKFGIDFRTVYAGILESWMKADSKAILGGTYRPAGVVKGS